MKIGFDNTLYMQKQKEHILERIDRGEVHYDFVEVMACPGGCVGGGGQPIDKEDRELGGIRGDRLHQLQVGLVMEF